MYATCNSLIPDLFFHIFKVCYLFLLDSLFSRMSRPTQTTTAPNYSCNQNNNSIEFTFSWSNHSAWNPTTECSLQQCHGSRNNNNTCGSSSTPCFDYRTLTNTSYCAPASQCSILEPCDNIRYACASNTSICVVNSCCSPQAICLPLLWTNLCILGNAIFCTNL